MNGNNYHTMSAICDTSLGWIYRELMNKIKILELLSDAEFLCAFFHVNFIFLYTCINWLECKTWNVSQMWHNVSDQKSYTEVIIRRS